MDGQTIKNSTGRYPVESLVIRMTENQRAVLQEAIDTYGKDNQLWMVIEEMSELAKEICKNKRGQDNEDQIADEIADVTIMLEQAKMIFGNADQVEKQIQYKVNRLKFRLSPKMTKYLHGVYGRETGTELKPLELPKWKCELCGQEKGVLRLYLSDWEGWACLECIDQIGKSAPRRYVASGEQTEPTE